MRQDAFGYRRLDQAGPESYARGSYEQPLALSRLLASEGRREEAHDVLSEIYNLFNEGFDTADLKEAKALLEELSAARSEKIQNARVT